MINSEGVIKLFDGILFFDNLNHNYQKLLKKTGN